jgi:UDPglucose 6-dehydrogenase
VTLTTLAREKNESLPLISAIKQSNDEHRNWNLRRLQLRLGDLRGKTLTILGLTYKPGTDTLRRSAALELGRELVKCGALVRAVDPAVKTLPEQWSGIQLVPDVHAALKEADAAVVCTEWPEFRKVQWPDAIAAMRGRLILDANGFLQKELKAVPGVEHVSVGS